MASYQVSPSYSIFQQYHTVGHSLSLELSVASAPSSQGTPSQPPFLFSNSKLVIFTE